MSHLRAVYLTGEQVYLRALTPDDDTTAVAWLDTLFPVNQPAAEEALKEEEGNPWLAAHHTFAIARLAGDEVVGGVKISSHRGAVYVLQFHMAPWLSAEETDGLRADALTVMIPWLRDEREAAAVVVEVAADEPVTAAAAEMGGMTLTARLRRFLARPSHRVDLLIYETRNRRREGSYA